VGARRRDRLRRALGGGVGLMIMTIGIFIASFILCDLLDEQEGGSIILNCWRRWRRK
jgi:hypothetical protein